MFEKISKKTNLVLEISKQINLGGNFSIGQLFFLENLKKKNVHKSFLTKQNSCGNYPRKLIYFWKIFSKASLCENYEGKSDFVKVF